MPEIESLSDVSWFLFIIQQISVPLFTLIVLFVIAVPFEEISRRSRFAEAICVLLVYACPPVAGWTLGRIASKLSPTFRASGRVIWVIPAVLFVLLLTGSAYSDWQKALVTAFMFRNDEPESGLGVVLITFPTVACCFYSFAVGSLRARKRETN